MSFSAPPKSDFSLSGDIGSVDSQLDDVLPGWRESFRRDLPEDLDLRPAIARVRALLLMVQVRVAAGDVTVTGLTPIQSVGKTCEWIRAQLYGSEFEHPDV
ncbi:MAG TPA: hypothetical protein VGH89_38290 [Pseudonocardia sp.]|jgi:hypothetical protein